MSEQEVSKPAAGEGAATTPVRLPDIAYTLYLGQFQQLSVLAVALAGGALLLHQVGLFPRPWNGPVGAIFFSLSALVAAMAPMDLAASVIEGRDVRKAMRRYAAVALLFLGMGTGAVIMGLVRAAMK